MVFELSHRCTSDSFIIANTQSCHGYPTPAYNRASQQGGLGGKRLHAAG
jgi:hypothetical protein